MENQKYNKKKQDLQLSTNDIGKIQPQAVELEEAVLGSLLIESKAYQDIEDILTVDDFYVEPHRIIFKSIFNLSSKRKPIDMLTVVEELRSMGELEAIGGPVYIAKLTENVASSAHIVFHAQIIKQKSQQRKLIRITSEIQAKAFDETQDVVETIEDLEKSLTELVTSSGSCQSIPMSEALTLAMDKAAKVQELKEKGIRISITTGLHSLDETFACGWMAPDLIILGARPSMGKALPMEAKVLTPNGWVLNKNLQIGDQISSIDGKDSFVTGIYPQGVVETYEIEFSDGRKIECCKDHLWEVFSSKFSDKTRVLSTLQIKDYLSKVRYQSRMSIPQYCGKYGVHKEFIIHPYLLGVLLGDGMLTCGASWAKPDKFVVNKISNLISDEYKISEYSYNRFAITVYNTSNKFR